MIPLLYSTAVYYIYIYIYICNMCRYISAEVLKHFIYMELDCEQTKCMHAVAKLALSGNRQCTREVPVGSSRVIRRQG